MADRSIKVVLRAEVSSFKQAMVDAATSTQQFATKTQSYVQKNKDSIGQLSNSAGLAGAALTGLAVLAVSKAASFDASMSAVQAATMESADGMAALRKAAIDAGQATVFSASESAGAIESLAKAGVSTKDILNGGLTGALNLASSGAIAVADAADIAATALTQFKLSGDQTSHVADLLAAGANNAQGGVSDLGMALKQGGLVAHQTGLTIEETTATLSAFASAGLIGSDAGTSFKSMLQRLTPQSAEAQKAMDKYNLSAYDAQGNFIGMAAWADKLHDGLANLTVEQRNSTLATVFGSDAVRAASVIYDEAGAGITKWTDTVNQQGYAAEQASIRLDNLSGDVEQLKGSVETALIGMGEGAQGPLRSLTQNATDVVNAFSNLPPTVQQATLGIVGGGGLALLGIAGLGKLTVAASNAKNAFSNIGLSAKTAGIAAAGVGAAIGVATVAISAWAQANAELQASVKTVQDSLDPATGAIDQNTRAAIANELTVQHGWWIFKKDSASDAARALGVSLADVTDAILGNADAIERVHSVTRVYGPDAISLAQKLGISTSDLARYQLNLETEIKDYSQKVVPQALANQQSLNQVVSDGGDAASGAAGQADQLTEAEQAQAQATQDAADALQKWRDMVTDSDQSFLDLGSLYDGIIQKNKDVATQAADSSKSTKDSWQDFYDGTTVSAESYIAELQKQVDAQSAWESNMTAISDRVETTMTGDMQAAGEQMVDELLKLGPDGAAQVQLLHDMSADQFKKVVSLYQQKGTDAVTQFTQQIESSRAPKLPTPTVTPDNQYIQNFLYSQQGYLDRHPLALKPIWQNPAPPSFGSGVRRAGGGILPGSPSTTDNMMIAAASGEFVVNSRATAANRTLLEAINAGAPGYAGGGYVQAARYASVAPAAARVTVAAPSLAGLAIEGTLDLGGGLTGQIRGVVRNELAAADVATRYAGRP